MKTTTPRRQLMTLVGVALVTVALVEVAARLVTADAAPALRAMNEHTQLKTEQLHKVGQRDVAFIGTSMVLRGLDTATFEAVTGRTSYNAALPGGTPELMERWVTEQVLPDVQPGMVVWGLGSYDFAPNFGAEQADAYDDAPDSAPGLLAGIDRTGSVASVFLRERSVLRSPEALWGAEANSRRERFQRVAAELGPGGERIVSDADAVGDIPEVIQARLREFEPAESDRDLIAETVGAIRASGTEIVFIEMPFASSFTAAHPRGQVDADATSHAIQQLAHDLDVPLLSGFQDRFTDADFVDEIHLRRSSAIEFTLIIANELADASVPPQPELRDSIAGPANEVVECETVVVQDEYGLDVEIQRCVGDSSAETADPFEADADLVPIERLDNDPIVLAALTERLLLQGDCSRQPLESFDALAAAASWAAAIAEIEAAFEALTPLCGTENYQPAYQAILASLEAALDSVSPSSARLELVDSEHDAASLAVWALDLHDRISLYLTLVRAPAVSEVWFHVDEARLRFDLERRQSRGQTPELVTIGDSTVGNSIDAAALGLELGLDVANIGVPAADPEEWITMWDRLFSGIDQPNEVLWPITTHRFLSPETRNCRQLVSPRLEDTGVIRRRSFPQFREGFERTELFFGVDALAAPYDGSSVSLQQASRYDDDGNRRLSSAGYTTLDIASNPWYPNPKVCEQRVVAMETVIADLQGRGIEVTLVRLPLHADVWAAAPDRHDEAHVALTGIADRFGVDLISLFDDYDDTETTDGWHANELGRERVTRALLDALTAS